MKKLSTASVFSQMTSSAENITVILCMESLSVKDEQRRVNWYLYSTSITELIKAKSSHTQMTFQCHREILGLALRGRPLRSDSIDRSHTRWNLSMCHRLLSCLRAAYKQALIEWSQSKNGVTCVTKSSDVRAEAKPLRLCAWIFIRQEPDELSMVMELILWAFLYLGNILDELRSAHRLQIREMEMPPSEAVFVCDSQRPGWMALIVAVWLSAHSSFSFKPNKKLTFRGVLWAGKL